jgi:antitoxin component YwqK of YwqJK toxin-antitoxin module
MNMKTLHNTILAGIILLTVIPSSGVIAQKGDLEYRDGYYYKNGMLYTGTHITYFEDSTIQMEMKVRNGSLDGITRVFHPNGTQKEQRYYNEGEMDSLWINWNEKGVKLGEARYRSGKKDGFWYIWDDNGVKRYEMFYRKGKKAGTWYIWDENGNLLSEKRYDE